MVMRKLFISLCSLLLVNVLIAQINAPDDPALNKKAAEHQVLSADDMGMKNYRGAANSLHWLMINVPDYFEGMYIYAYKAYEQLANSEVDANKKKVLYDSMIISYRLKGQIFTLNDREKNNLAFKYYKYFKTDKDKIAEALMTYQEAYEYPENVINNNIVAYMDILKRYADFGNELSTNEVFEVFDQIIEVIEIKKEQGVSAKKLDQYHKIVNSILTSIIGNSEDGFDCGFIEENLGPRLDKEKNIDDAKRIFTLLLNNECTTNPYYIKSAEILWSAEPTSGIAKILARFHAELGDLELAAEWYEQAIEVTDTDAKKALIKMNLANIYGANDEKSKARDAAFAAIEFDKEVTKDAYNFVGNLYFNSFNDCKKEDDVFADYAVFMAAYDLYKKAGNTDGMTKAQAQFPAIAERHTLNRTEGETINIACWINIATKLKTRPTN
jgi:tetratricopeptide (TPR) repeat protein